MKRKKDYRDIFLRVSSSGENNRVVMATDNVIACEAISEKLNTVASVAEALDNVLRDTQHGLEVIETTTSEKKCENGTDVRLLLLLSVS